MLDMRFVLLLFTLLLACTSNREEKSGLDTVPFSSSQWKMKMEDTYPFRPQMYQEVLYSDSVRTLMKPQVTSMLGTPDREENNHFYYLIERTSMGSWTLSQKSLVIKFRPDDSVEWIKTYE